MSYILGSSLIVVGVFNYVDFGFLADVKNSIGPDLQN